MAKAISVEADFMARHGTTARAGGKEGGQAGAFAALLTGQDGKVQDGKAQGLGAQAGGQLAKARMADGQDTAALRDARPDANGRAGVAAALLQLVEALRSGALTPDALAEELPEELADNLDGENLARLPTLLRTLSDEMTEAQAAELLNQVAEQLDMAPDALLAALEGADAAAAGDLRLPAADGGEARQGDSRAALRTLAGLLDGVRETGGARPAAASGDGETVRAARLTGEQQTSPQQTGGTDGARQTARGGAAAEGELRIDTRTLDRALQQQADRGDGRFAGTRLDVSVTEQINGTAPQGRLSGEAVLTAQASLLAGEGEPTRNAQLRRGDIGREAAPAQALRAQAAQGQTAQSQTDAQVRGQQQSQAQSLQAQQDIAQARAEARAAAQALAGDSEESARAAPRGPAEAAAGSSGSDGRTAAATTTASTSAAAGGQMQAADPLTQAPQGLANTNAQATQGAEAAQRGTAAQQAAQARPTPAAQLRDQVAVQVQRAANSGQQRLSVRLNPAELGRIDVRLDLSDDGRVRAVLAVERAETLDMLQRDARGLERALNDAGLKTDGNSLDFNLGGGDGGGERDPDDDARHAGTRDGSDEAAAGSGDSAPLPDDVEDVPTPLRLVEQGVDVRV